MKEQIKVVKLVTGDLKPSSMSAIHCLQRRILYAWAQNKDVMNTELVHISYYIFFQDKLYFNLEHI
jgi:hypothetical protein